MTPAQKLDSWILGLHSSGKRKCDLGHIAHDVYKALVEYGGRVFSTVVQQDWQGSRHRMTSLWMSSNCRPTTCGALM